jgi:hypothetical protein
MVGQHRILASALFCATAVAFGFVSPSTAQVPSPAQPTAKAQKITVESVRGSVQFARRGQFQDLTTDSELTQGDTLVVETGAVCKLQFKHPDTGVVESAAVVRGYTELTVAEAYQRGELTRTQLDVPQGNLRIGVRRTTTPPSFNVRTPRTVVGVRGTNWGIRVGQSGDQVDVGGTGIVSTRDNWDREYSSGPCQAVFARGSGIARGSPLIRSIEYEPYRSRLFLDGPWRDGLEPFFDPYLFEPTLFNPDWGKSEGNPAYEARRNGGHSFELNVPPCPTCRNGKR